MNDSITLDNGTTYRVGHMVDSYGLRHLPIGTTMHDGGGRGFWTMVVGGWVNPHGTYAPMSPRYELRLNYNILRTLPDPPKPAVPDGLGQPLSFVEAYDTYSVYRDRDGAEVYLGPGGQRLVDYDDIDLTALWRDWSDKSRPDQFEVMLRKLLTDPDIVDDIRFCQRCEGPRHVDDMYSIDEGDGTVCDSCVAYFATCRCCDGRFTETTTTLNDTQVCERCLDNNYSYCDYCDGYCPDDEDHYHGGCDCESPQMNFAVPNGGEPLANDTRTTVSLPAGVISPEGIAAIHVYLRNWAASYLATYEPDGYTRNPVKAAYRNLAGNLHEVESTWQTKRGNYTKRLSAYAYKNFALSLDAEVLAQVGNIARDHSRGATVGVEVTRDLNQDAGFFYHGGSCWWSDFAQSRCTLKSNGGFGLRSFNDYGSVSGRSWVIPLRWTGTIFTPTFETLAPDAFVVFNNYGALDGYAGARVMAQLTGWTYRKVGFSCEHMYTNGDGYLIAPEALADAFNGPAVGFNAHISLSVAYHSDLFGREQDKADEVETQGVLVETPLVSIGTAVDALYVTLANSTFTNASTNVPPY